MITSIDDVKEEQAIFLQAWQMLKNHFGINDKSTDAEWEALVKDAISIHKMGQTKAQQHLSKALAEGLIDYFDHTARRV